MQFIIFFCVGGVVFVLLMFDIIVYMKGGGNLQFSNINCEDFKGFEDFFQYKGFCVKNEIDEDVNMFVVVMRVEDMVSLDEEVVQNKVDCGLVDEDEESVDEDFQVDLDSDVVEEYDSNYESDGLGSGESDVDNEVDDDEDEEMEDVEEEEEEWLKKKKKIG